MTANCVTNLFKEAAAELQENQEMTLSKNTQLPPLKKSIIIVNRESRLTIPIVYLQPHGNTAGHQLVAQHDRARRNKKKNLLCPALNERWTWTKNKQRNLSIDKENDSLAIKKGGGVYFAALRPLVPRSEQ